MYSARKFAKTFNELHARNVHSGGLQTAHESPSNNKISLNTKKRHM